MDKLPVEIFSKIIDYLTPREQVQLQSVSKHFFTLARDNTLWRLHCYEESWIAAEARRPTGGTTGTQVGLNSTTTTSLSSLGQTSLLSLIQPSHTQLDEDEFDDQGQLRVSSLGERSRGAAAWDPSYEGEDVDWYSEYIARHGPVSFSWLQQPVTGRRGSSKRDSHEVKGMGLLKDWSSERRNKVVAPLNDGSVCIWDLNHSHYSDSRATKGKLLGISAPGILMEDISRRRENSSSKAALDFISLGECVSVDSIRQRAFIAVGNALNEVDLETLRVVSQQRYPWSVFALSQETDYSVPMTLATTLSLHIYDSRLPVTEEEAAISLRCEKAATPFVPESRLFTHPDYPILQLQPNGLPPQRIRSPDPSEKGANYAPLFQPGPLALLHPPAPHVNTVLLAGRFPSILSYDRRYFPRLQSTVHSGSRLCGLASVPAPRFPIFSESTWSDSHAVASCGEYNGRGSLELYSLTSSNRNCDSNPSNSASSLYSVYKNRQSAASSKLLSVGSHGTRLVYSDAEGNIKWVERDGRTEVRRWNINTHASFVGHNRQPQRSASRSRPNGNNHGSTGLWRRLSHSSENSEVARKVLPTGGNLTGDELLLWTGERIGRIKFSGLAGGEDEDEDEEEDDMSIDESIGGEAREEVRSRKREERRKENEYTGMMRKVLERQADEVRWTGGFGKG